MELFFVLSDSLWGSPLIAINRQLTNYYSSQLTNEFHEKLMQLNVEMDVALERGKITNGKKFSASVFLDPTQIKAWFCEMAPLVVKDYFNNNNTAFGIDNIPIILGAIIAEYL